MKTTRSIKQFPFLVSRNEVEFSAEVPDQFSPVPGLPVQQTAGGLLQPGRLAQEYCDARAGALSGAPGLTIITLATDLEIAQDLDARLDAIAVRLQLVTRRLPQRPGRKFYRDTFSCSSSCQTDPTSAASADARPS